MELYLVKGFQMWNNLEVITLIVFGALCISVIIDIILKIALERHGHCDMITFYNGSFKYFECSACHSRFNIGDFTIRPKYCPSCGRKVNDPIFRGDTL